MKEFAAILVAGGSSQRMLGLMSRPKQFFKIKGYPLYIWCISKILLSDIFRYAVIVVPDIYLNEITLDVEEYIKKLPIDSKSLKIFVTSGGASRQASVYAGLSALKNALSETECSELTVLIHDAARPFASNRLIKQCIESAASQGRAMTAGLPVTDTIKQVDATGTICKTIDRSNLYSVQTPQAAPYNLLLSCHEAAIKDGVAVTDDAAILEAYGHEVGIVTGDTYNIKLTIQEDFALSEQMSTIYLPEHPWLNR